MSAQLTDVSGPRQWPDADPWVDADFGAVLAQCALTWHQQPDEAATVSAVTAYTPRLLRGADAAAVVTGSTSGTLKITASAGPIQQLYTALPRTLTPHQWTGPQVRPPMSRAGRWPVSVTLDQHAQMGSMICAPLGSGAMMFGTLLVLAFATDAFTPASATDVTTLAMHASIVLATHRQRAHWQEALISRDVIGQAKGILMQQRHLTADQAFTELQRVSQNSNIKLRQVAETLCHTGELINPPPSR